MKKIINSIKILLAGLIILSFTTSYAQDKIKATEAQKYVGETKTVCGKVVSTFYSYSSKGQPTFLNIDKPYPNNIFTVVILGQQPEEL